MRDRIFRSYFVNGRGDEWVATSWTYLDLTALGRQTISCMFSTPGRSRA